MKKILLSVAATSLLLVGCATKKDEPKKPKEPYELIIKVNDGLGISTYTQHDVKEFYTNKGTLTITLNNGEKIKTSMFTLKEKGEK
ncbi:hypothetical protein JANET_120 [Bacillus phage Janet]|nr:hypothetical protein JANET_120 [Bacillus phage Janet]